MKQVFSGLNLLFLLCLFFLSGCATSKPTKPSSYSKETIFFVTSEQANLRSCPSLKCKVIAVLNRGDEIVRIGKKNEWLEIKVKATGREGWLASRLTGKDLNKKPPTEINEEWSPPDK